MGGAWGGKGGARSRRRSWRSWRSVGGGGSRCRSRSQLQSVRTAVPEPCWERCRLKAAPRCRRVKGKRRAAAAASPCLSLPGQPAGRRGQLLHQARCLSSAAPVRWREQSSPFPGSPWPSAAGTSRASQERRRRRRRRRHPAAAAGFGDFGARLGETGDGCSASEPGPPDAPPPSPSPRPSLAPGGRSFPPSLPNRPSLSAARHPPPSLPHEPKSWEPFLLLGGGATEVGKPLSGEPQKTTGGRFQTRRSASLRGPASESGLGPSGDAGDASLPPERPAGSKPPPPLNALPRVALRGSPPPPPPAPGWSLPFAGGRRRMLGFSLNSRLTSAGRSRAGKPRGCRWGPAGAGGESGHGGGRPDVDGRREAGAAGETSGGGGRPDRPLALSEKLRLCLPPSLQKCCIMNPPTTRL